MYSEVIDFFLLLLLTFEPLQKAGEPNVAPELQTLPSLHFT